MDNRIQHRTIIRRVFFQALPHTYSTYGWTWNIQLSVLLHLSLSLSLSLFLSRKYIATYLFLINVDGDGTAKRTHIPSLSLSQPIEPILCCVGYNLLSVIQFQWLIIFAHRGLCFVKMLRISCFATISFINITNHSLLQHLHYHIDSSSNISHRRYHIIRLRKEWWVADRSSPSQQQRKQQQHPVSIIIVFSGFAVLRRLPQEW